MWEGCGAACSASLSWLELTTLTRRYVDHLVFIYF